MYTTNRVLNITKLGETIVSLLFLELSSEHASTYRNKCVNETTWEPNRKLGQAGTLSNIKNNKTFH